MPHASTTAASPASPDVSHSGWDAGLVPQPGFATLGERFFTRLPPAPLPDPVLIDFSEEAGTMLGLDRQAAQAQDFVEVFTGNRIPSWADPLATVYSGHQFGVWAGQLGDGRALRLAEVATADGPLEVQLKGAGRTPYSRMADGRAVLRSSIREFLCSEAMAGLGIPTSRALCITGSNAPVRREEIETAAVVTRLAPSFIRFGHFEHFGARDDIAALRQLADFVIDRFYPQCRAAAQPYAALLREVTVRTADLMADWQAVGFCHGVMNTDNMSILGLTIDYGPFGFLDGFNANHICNHSDTQGRYAYQQQPQIGFWNLHCLAQAMLPLLLDPHGTAAESDDESRQEAAIALAHESLGAFRERYAAAFLARYRAKLGLATTQDNDEQLLAEMFGMLHAQRIDYTLFFRNLAAISSTDDSEDAPVRDLFLDRSAWQAWAASYRQRLQLEHSVDEARSTAMRAVNPKYILRNHLAEIAIRRARENDFSEVARLRQLLSRPFDEQPDMAHYAALPPDWASGLEVSCSS
ncbi:protein adenylyltransferase SelO [Imbroritus primus]|uniref:protein adenylyltransferase SelO n=1 Tax=Imbroritus primus TaxID=3058603 RepID=UPI003D161E27